MWDVVWRWFTFSRRNGRSCWTNERISSWIWTERSTRFNCPSVVTKSTCRIRGRIQCQPSSVVTDPLKWISCLCITCSNLALFCFQKSLIYLSNYIARAWSTTTGCVLCKEDLFDVTKIENVSQPPPVSLWRTLCLLQLMDWPMVYIALFIEYPTPFLQEYFEKIMKITYPKQRLGILIHNHVRLTPESLARHFTNFTRIGCLSQSADRRILNEISTGRVQIRQVFARRRWCHRRRSSAASHVCSMRVCLSINDTNRTVF